MIGQFSVGKSALLNALLGDELLSTRRIESTKVLTRIRYCAPNQKPSILLQFQHKSSEEISVNDLSELEKYTTFQGTGITDELRFVDVFWPLPFLDEQLMLEDTPGANSLTATAFSTTEEASAVYYLFNGQKGIDRVMAACAPRNSSTVLICFFRKANLIVETNMKVSCTCTHHESCFILHTTKYVRESKLL